MKLKIGYQELIANAMAQIETVPLDNAKQLLDKHTKDEEFVALSKYKNIKIWTYEERLFDLGFGISTKEISDNLK